MIINYNLYSTWVCLYYILISNGVTKTGSEYKIRIDTFKNSWVAVIISPLVILTLELKKIECFAIFEFMTDARANNTVDITQNIYTLCT